jgi:hypothetical protein
MARVELVRNERLSVVDDGRREEEEGEKAQADVKREGSRLIPVSKPQRGCDSPPRLASPRLAPHSPTAARLP